MTKKEYNKLSNKEKLDYYKTHHAWKFPKEKVIGMKGGLVVTVEKIPKKTKKQSWEWDF